MPIPAQSVKLTAFGLMATGQQWSTSIWTNIALVSGAWNLNNFQSYVTAQRAFFDTWWTAVKALNASSVDYRGLKAVYYNTTGGPASLVAQSTAAPVVGTGSTNIHPSLTCMVASFRTALPGARNRGRSYLPVTSSAVTAADLQFSSGTATAIGSAYLALFNSLNGYTSAPNNVSSQQAVVISRAGTAFNRISSIVVDTIPDTQHRREDKLIATAVSTTAVP